MRLESKHIEEARQIAREEKFERQLKEESERLSAATQGSLVHFVRAAWPSIKPQELYHHNWHIEIICEHLEAVTRGEIDRLQIWIPPGMMKSMLVSVFWHPWEWTRKPWVRYWTASYETRLSGRLAAMSRDLMLSDWYRAHWGDVFTMTRDAEHYFGNDKGGTRLATSPESTGSGEHGHRIIIDDPINAKEADATSKTTLDFTNEVWYDGTVSTRGIASGHARILIMQRLHENDLAAHLLKLEEWTVLCLPERYEPDHPYAWRGDPRSAGDLLWPSYRDEAASNALAASLRTQRVGAQLQQRPAPKEGQMLKRHYWRFYDPKLFAEAALANRRPRFRWVVQSVDTPLKDKESNDLVAIQAWGIVGADRYLLDLRKGHMSYAQAKRAIRDQARFVRGLYPRARHSILIENAGYGVELIEELKREITGVTKIAAGSEGNKEMRAEAASADLESGNCFLPGYRLGNDEFSLPDESRTPADVVDFINSCALFPNAEHDDDVDAWSQCMNYVRTRSAMGGRTSSPFKRRRRQRAPA